MDKVELGVGWGWGAGDGHRVMGESDHAAINQFLSTYTDRRTEGETSIHIDMIIIPRKERVKLM